MLTKFEKEALTEILDHEIPPVKVENEDYDWPTEAKEPSFFENVETHICTLDSEGECTKAASLSAPLCPKDDVIKVEGLNSFAKKLQKTANDKYKQGLERYKKLLSYAQQRKKVFPEAISKKANFATTIDKHVQENT
jgi:hypothetical protein